LSHVREKRCNIGVALISLVPDASYFPYIKPICYKRRFPRTGWCRNPDDLIFLGPIEKFEQALALYNSNETRTGQLCN